MANPRILIIALSCAAAVTLRVQAGVTPSTEDALARGLVYPIQPTSSFAPGFGCAFVDLDGDGDLDVVVLGKSDRSVGVFENDGTGLFTDRSGNGVPTMIAPASVSAADYDGDGDLDLFLGDNVGPDVLARNDGGFQFTNVAAAAGVDYVGPSEAGSWADYDNDGDLDMYLCVYTSSIETNPLPNRLYRNDGDGTFTDIAAAQGVDDIGCGFQSVWFDYDRDGDVDLYLSNDRGGFAQYPTNQLWRNDGLAFANVSVGSGADVGIWSMGVACGDFDGNGWADLYCTNISSGANPLLLNQGDGTFLDQAAILGVDQFITSWGAIFFDFENDGPMELYVNNDFEANSLWAQNPGFPCVNIAPLAGMEGVPWTGGFSGRSYCSAVGDVDGDGDLDLLETNLGTNVQLYINHEGQTRNRIRMRLVGEEKNLHAIGGSADVRLDGVCHFREVLAGGNGYLGQNELTVHVGTGAMSTAEQVTVRWPGGSPVRILSNLPANTPWTVYPPSRLGDADGDGTRTHDDYLLLVDCFGGAMAPGCEMMDFNGDSLVDELDAAAFFSVYDGELTDCNDNGERDLFDILIDPGIDGNDNRIPDSCEVPGDTDGDGVVNVNDLVIVIQAWGPCPAEGPCPGDVTGDDEVNVDDLVRVIQEWS